MHTQQDAAERTLNLILRNPDDQIRVLADWANAAFGKGAARAFNQLKPAQVSKLLSSVIKAAHGVTHHVVNADHALRLDDPLVAAVRAASKP